MLRPIWMILACLGLAGAPALPALAKEQQLAAAANGQITFMTPSGNIGCIYTPKGGTSTYEPVGGGPELSCDRVEPSYVNITLGPKGPAVLTKNPGEQACCGGDNTFAYGNTAHMDGFVCKSATTGLICQTPAGHGFWLAKTKTLHY
jgi:hypothetical protein